MARKFKSMDGNEAAAYVSYAYTEVAGIYPITPSSPMADHVDQWAAQGRKNIFGTPVKVVEMESEAGAAGTVHGSLGAGALTTTYTASQGLLLMIPNMYKIAGEQLPGVFHVSARCVASHALNIFGDHSDVMACRQTGFAMLAEGNVQEVMDLSPVAHLAAIEGKTPFLNFFDGFRTSHEIQKVAMWDYKDLAEMCDMDAVQAFRDHALNPEHPHTRGSHENGDIFFQNREACNKVYDELPAVVEGYMKKINEKLGTDYGLFNYYGAPDADRVVVCMGSFCDVLEEVIDYLNAHGEKVGLVKVRLFRPFSIKHFVDVLPETVQKIAVMDRTKEPGSIGEPLYQDVVSALYEAGKTGIKVVGGRYGLGSKDTPPASAFAVFEELKKDEPKREFTIGIVDDVTNLSLPEAEDAPNTAAPGTIECKFWGLGGDGTVGANKNSIKIIGDHTDKYVQAYFQYDSKKTGGVTISHLRFGDKPIKSPYYINKADFVACHNPSYITKGFPIVRDVKPGGVFMINCQWTPEELAHHLDAASKRYIAKNNIQLYTIDAIDLAQKISDQVVCVKEHRVDRVGTPEEVMTTEYIQELYAMQDGVYDAAYGSVEFPKPTGDVHTFVIGGGGYGIPLYRKLQRQGIPCAAGILPVHDREYPVAKALCEKVLEIPAFTMPEDTMLAQAKALIDACETVYCPCMEFGVCNSYNQELYFYAKKQNKLKNLSE